MLAPFLSPSLSAQERQVAFDSKDRLFVLTGEQNATWGVLAGYPTLVEARIFKRSDSTYYIDLTLQEGSQRVREQKEIDANDYVAIQRSTDEGLDRGALPEPVTATDRLDQSGRSALLWGSTLWSLFYYGAATSVAITGEADAAWTYLIAGGLGYLVPALLTNNATVTDGEASLALSGMFQGVLHGWALAAIIQGDAIGDESRLGFGLSVVTGITETVVGYTVAHNTKLEEGKAGVISTTAFYGLTTGLLTSAMLFDQVDTDSDPAVRIGGALALGGSVAGIVVGNAISNAQHYAPGDATIYATTGLLGLTLPLAVLSAVQPDDISGTLIGALSIAGTVGGLFAGTNIVRGMDYRSEDGTITILSTFGGALIGFGVAYAFDADDAAGLLPWVGGAAGFGLSLVLAKPNHETRSTGSLEFDVNPAGPWMTTIDQYGFTRTAPFATMKYRF